MEILFFKRRFSVISIVAPPGRLKDPALRPVNKIITYCAVSCNAVNLALYVLNSTSIKLFYNRTN